MHVLNLPSDKEKLKFKQKLGYPNRVWYTEHVMRRLTMDIKIDSLIPFDSLKTNIGHVFSVVEKNGKAVLLKDNKPAYIVLKYDENSLADTGIGTQEMPNYTLH